MSKIDSKIVISAPSLFDNSNEASLRFLIILFFLPADLRILGRAIVIELSQPYHLAQTQALRMLLDLQTAHHH